MNDLTCPMDIPAIFPIVPATHVHHSTSIISERRIRGSRMGSAAVPSKVRSSGQRQLTQLIPPSEKDLVEWLYTRRVETAAVEIFDDFLE